MHRIAIILAATALLAVPPGAFATQITIDNGLSDVPILSGPNAIGAGVPNTGGVAPDLPAAGSPPPAAVLPTTNADLAIKALSTTTAKLAAIGGLTATSMVHIVIISATDSSVPALAKARTDKQADVAKLQAAISANASFKADLQAKMVDISKIVAADLASDKSLILYATG